MTLAAIFATVISLAATPNGAIRPAVVVWQEEPKPAPQEPVPSPSKEEHPPSGMEPAPEQNPPVTPETVAPPAPESTPPTAENPPSKPVSAKTTKPKVQTTRTRKARARKRAAKPPGNPNEPKKVVISNGSTAEPVIQISSGKPSAPQDLNSTSSLLDATNSNLKKIAGRQLTPAQQDMVKQIGSYMDQAKAASGIGDTQGAHNLAFKAHLLSEELLRQ